MILEHCGFIDPEDMNHYIDKDGYAALRKILTLEPEEVRKKSNPPTCGAEQVSGRHQVGSLQKTKRTCQIRNLQRR